MTQWSEDLMLRYLWRHFSGQMWSAIPQVTVAIADLNPEFAGIPAWGTEFVPTRIDVDTDRRIDMLCIRRPPKRNDVGDLESLAIEVKVSRSDFLADVRNNEKQAAWRQAATRHAYAVPRGLVTVDEVPAGSGLMVVDTPTDTDWGRCEWARYAPYRLNHAPVLPARVLQAINYRIAALEGKTRGWSSPPDATSGLQELRAALQHANKVAERESAARKRAEGRVTAWRGAYALLNATGHPCRWCGNPVKPKNAAAGTFKAWKHVYPMDDEACSVAELAVRERQARIAYENADERTRDRQLSLAHRVAAGGFNEDAEKEPWRGFIEVDWSTLTPRLLGPMPANVLPEDA